MIDPQPSSGGYTPTGTSVLVAPPKRFHNLAVPGLKKRLEELHELRLRAKGQLERLLNEEHHALSGSYVLRSAEEKTHIVDTFLKLDAAYGRALQKYTKFKT